MEDNSVIHNDLIGIWIFHGIHGSLSALKKTWGSGTREDGILAIGGVADVRTRRPTRSQTGNLAPSAQWKEMSRVQRFYHEWDQEHDYLAPNVSSMLSYKWRVRRASDFRNIVLVRTRPKVRWKPMTLRLYRMCS